MRHVLWSMAVVLLIALSTADGYAQGGQPAEPYRAEFVPVEKDPIPLTPLQDLMKFPLDAPDSISSSKVKLRLLIDTSGNVLKAMIDISGGAAFDAAAKNAALQAKFSPAAQNGQPVKVWYEASVVFKRPN